MNISFPGAADTVTGTRHLLGARAVTPRAAATRCCCRPSPSALMLRVQRLRPASEIPADMPVFLDSPMASTSTTLTLRYRKRLRVSPKETGSMCDGATIVTTVSHLEGFSCHAEAGELTHWQRGLHKLPLHAVVVHGESQASAATRIHIPDEPGWKVSAPEHLSTSPH